MTEQNPTIPTGDKTTEGTGTGRQVQVHLREDKMHVAYSNMCRLAPGANWEEVMIDFAITSQNAEKPEVMMMDVNTRVYMSLFAAKRLALTLSQAIQRYEQQFGPVELDPRRRLKQG